MIFYVMGFILVNFIMAYIHSRLILHNRPIIHWVWALVYFALMAFGFWFTRSWMLVIVSLLLREVVFAQALNMIRGKKWFYVNPTTGSIIDKIQGSAYKYLWFGSLASLIFTQFILYKKPKA